MNKDIHLLCVTPEEHTDNPSSLICLIVSSPSQAKRYLVEAGWSPSVLTLYCVDEPPFDRDRRLGISPNRRVPLEKISSEHIATYTGGVEFHAHISGEDDFECAEEELSRFVFALPNTLSRVWVFAASAEDFPSAIFSTEEELNCWVHKYGLDGNVYSLDVDDLNHKQHFAVRHTGAP